MRAGWCSEAAHKYSRGWQMCWLMAFRGGPRKRLIRDYLPFFYRRVRWQETRLGKSGGTTSSGILQAYCRWPELLLRLKSLMRPPGVCGRNDASSGCTWKSVYLGIGLLGEDAVARDKSRSILRIYLPFSRGNKA